MSISQVCHENHETQALLNLSPNLLRFLLYLRKEWFSKYHVVSASQKTFAKDMGVARETINRWLKLLREIGVIDWKRNLLNGYETCQYRATSLFKQNLFRLREINVMYKYAALTIGILVTATEPRITPYKDIRGEEIRDCYLSSPVSLFTTQPTLHESQTACERAREKETPKKEFNVEMNAVPEWVTPQIKQATKLLNLSRWGQIRLVAYPSTAVEYAIKALRDSRGKKENPFGWFTSICHSWCSRNRVAPDWSLMKKIADENGMPDDPMLIISGAFQEEEKQPETRKMGTIGSVSYEERHAKLLADEREKMRAKQRTWEESKSLKYLEEKLDVVFSDMEKLSPIQDPIEHKKEIVRLLEAEGYLSQMEWLMLERYRKAIRECVTEEASVNIEAPKKEGRNDAEAPTTHNGIRDCNRTDPVEESGMQFQQTSPF